MRANRQGEDRPVPFRSGRLFSVGDKWYFATREGLDHGPFDSRADAEAELRLFLRDIATADQRLIT
ncbi:MAG: DUF6316 family protein [Gammaproteobacteria bacterium]|nr:DUF6316 family protein [Gammaproteobacteria bacterium]